MEIKKLVFKNYVPTRDCKSEKSNSQKYIAKNLDVVMPMYNFIEYSNNYSNTSRILWQYCRDEPIVDGKGVLLLILMQLMLLNRLILKQK